MLSKKQLEQIDSEIAPLRDADGKLSKNKLFSWLSMKGGMTYEMHLGVPTPVVVKEYREGKILYQLFMDQFEEYARWKQSGKKDLPKLGDFGIKNGTKKQTNKGVESSGTDVQDDFDKDIPF